MELKNRLPEVEIVWRAFELRPQPVLTLDPDGEYLWQTWHGSVYPLAQRLEVTIRMPPLQPRSRLAHEAAAWARLRGDFDAMNAAIFRAFFERGEDIGDAEVLARLAPAGADLRRALTAHEFLPDVLRDEERAAAIGLSGVPAFICGRNYLVGVQPADALEQLVRASLEPVRE